MSEETFSFGEDDRKAKAKPFRRIGHIRSGAVALALGAVGIGYVALTAGDRDRPASLDTSSADEFQGRANGPRESPFPNLDLDGTNSRTAEMPPVLGPPEPSRHPLQAEVDRLRAELAAGNGSKSGLVDELRELTARLDAVQKDLDQSRKDAERAREQQAAELEARLAAAREAEDRRRQAAADQEFAAETRARQVASKSLIFDQGKPSGASGAGSSGQETAGAGIMYNPDGSRREPGVDERGRSFVERPRPVAVAQSGNIANPGITLAQGTIIRATLDTALASNLPGQIVATVNAPVESMDGSRILVQPGSRLFGDYQTASAVGERRIQVAWSRILTPDGVSIELASFGGDQLGRSGVTGRIDSRWGTRFAAAALISLIGIGPALLAENASSETEEDAITDMGQSLVSALAPTVSQYMNLPPIINVKQGSAVTVIVNKDIEVLR